MDINLDLEITKLVVTFLTTGLSVGGAAWFAIGRAKQAYQDARRQDEDKFKRDQDGLLVALRGELSANLYLLMDQIDDRSGSARTVKLARRIFDANAQRINLQTSRAYAWLSVLYTRLEALEETDDVRSKNGLIEPLLGHAILMTIGLNHIIAGDAKIQLTEISDDEFLSYISGFTKREADILFSARRKWLEAINDRGRT